MEKLIQGQNLSLISPPKVSLDYFLFVSQMLGKNFSKTLVEYFLPHSTQRKVPELSVTWKVSEKNPLHFKKIDC